MDWQHQYATRTTSSSKLSNYIVNSRLTTILTRLWPVNGFPEKVIEIIVSAIKLSHFKDVQIEASHLNSWPL